MRMLWSSLISLFLRPTTGGNLVSLFQPSQAKSPVDAGFLG